MFQSVEASRCGMLNQVIYSSALWLLLLLAPALAVELVMQKCPRNMTAVGKLNFENYSGTWYMQMMFPNLIEAPSMCRYNVLKANDDGHIFVHKVEVNSITQTMSRRTVPVRRWSGNGGHYELESGLVIFVLDTDYLSYAIEYSCFDTNGYMSVEWAAIKTRKRTPSTVTMHTAGDLAISHGINVSKMISIEQMSCPSSER